MAEGFPRRPAHTIKENHHIFGVPSGLCWATRRPPFQPEAPPKRIGGFFTHFQRPQHPKSTPHFGVQKKLQSVILAGELQGVGGCEKQAPIPLGTPPFLASVQVFNQLDNLLIFN